LDAPVFMVGLLLGILGFAELYPVISTFAWSGALETQTLLELFGLPSWVTALAVAGMALGLFWLSAVVERRFRHSSRI
jgi:hypothetical protein